MTKDLSPLEVQEELLRRKRAEETLLGFVEYTHPNWTTSPCHVVMCEWLEKLANGEITRLAINAPPRHGKTEIASRRFPAWVLGRNPSWQIISTSAGTDLSSDIGADVRDILRDPTYRNVFPETNLRADAAAAGRWRTSSGGVYIAGSVGSQIVGRGANIGIIDDPHKGAGDVASQRLRDVVGNWYWGDFFNRLMPPRLQLLIMTRWHEDDLSGRILGSEDEWEQVDDSGWVWKAGSWHVLKLQALTQQEDGTERGLQHVNYPDETLFQMREDHIKAGRGKEWRSLFQQEPVAEEGTYIRREWFDRRWKKEPQSMRIYIAGDFAVTDRSAARDPDRTELGVFGLGPDDKMYILDWWSGQTRSDVWIEKLLDLVDRWHPLAFFGEVGVIRRAVEPMLKRRIRERKSWVRLEWMPTSRDKIARGQSFQNWASSGRVVLPATATWVEDWLAEMSAIPDGRYWDKFDTCSHMFLAIDKTHPAIVSPYVDKTPEPTDYKAIAEDDNVINLWKTA